MSDTLSLGQPWLELSLQGDILSHKQVISGSQTGSPPAITALYQSGDVILTSKPDTKLTVDTKRAFLGFFFLKKHHRIRFK